MFTKKRGVRDTSRDLRRPPRAAEIGRGLDELETRLVMDSGVINVAASFNGGGEVHEFVITQIEEDPDDDGRVGTNVVHFVGQIKNLGNGSFHTLVGVQLVAFRTGGGGGTGGGGTQIGSFSFSDADRDVATDSASFRIRVTLDPNSPAVQNVVFRITRTGFTGAANIVRGMTGTGSALTARLQVVDLTPPQVLDVIDVLPDPRDNPVDSVEVQFSEVIEPTSLRFSTLRLTRDGVAVPLDDRVGVAAISASRFRFSGLAPFTATSGVYRLTVDATSVRDTSGNAGVVGNAETDSDAWTVDVNLNRPPTPGAADLRAGSDTGSSSTDNLTSAASPTFDVSSGIQAGNTATLVRAPADGGTPLAVASRVGAGPLTDPSAPEGRFNYFVRQTNALGRTSLDSPPLPVTIDRRAPTATATLPASDQTFTGGNVVATTRPNPSLLVTVSDPARGFAEPVRVELVAVDGRLLGSPLAQTVTLPIGDAAGSSVVASFPPLPVALAPGLHRVTIRLTDLAGNVRSVEADPFLVIERRASDATGSPIFATRYDLSPILKDLVPDSGAGLYPWNASFDRTTQTVWFELKGNGNDSRTQRGNHVIQVDPATNTFRIYDLKITAPTLSSTGAHSIFFDFESHNTPRVWFAQQDAGKLSYLDIATGEIVTYDLRDTIAELMGREADHVHADVHAVVVDRRGVAWVSDPADGLVLEIDTREFGPGGRVDVGSDSGRIRAHAIPEEFLDGFSHHGDNDGLPFGEVGGHGLDVVIDDRPGQGAQPYLYFTVLGSGRVGLLVPANDSVPGRTADRWSSWDLREALREEGSVTRPGNKPYGHPLFVSIDNAETPGNPEDDRLLVGDPGAGSGDTDANSAVRILPVRDVVRNPNTRTSPVTTLQLSPPDAADASRPNQVYVDRVGGLFYIDRKLGIGRVAGSGGALPNPLLTPGRLINAPIASVLPGNATRPASAVLKPTSRSSVSPAVVSGDRTRPIFAGRVSDSDPSDGLDRYTTLGGSLTGNRSLFGPFRGTINAGSNLYGAITQSDEFLVATFAETVRRPVDVVVTPAGDQLAFQVLRNGDLILTRRARGEVVSRQHDVTRTAFGGVPGPAFFGDPAATVDSEGKVSVFGRDARGGLMAYIFNTKRGTWSVEMFALPAASAGTVANSPTALEPLGTQAGALVTTGAGHLLLFRSGSAPIDLSARLAGGAGSVPIYGEVGAVAMGGRIFAYGTDMTGRLVEYSFAPDGSSVSARAVVVEGGSGDGSSTRALQGVDVILAGGLRRIFATNGASQLVAITLDEAGAVRSAVNVSARVQPTATGYSDYQRPFAGRVYSDVSAEFDERAGILYVYGTNGRDLIEFRGTLDGSWSASNLTNDLQSGGISNPANRVFGAPALVLEADGTRRILQINEDGDIVEYYKLAGLPFATYNVTLAQGNSASGPPRVGSDAGPSYPNVLTPPPNRPADDFPNAPAADAAPLPLANGGSATISGVIGTATDADAFRFTSPRSGRMVVDLKAVRSSLGLPSGLDTLLVIYDARGRVVATNDNASRDTTDSRLTFKAARGRTYYLVVQSRRGTSGGYQLNLAGAATPTRRTKPTPPVRLTPGAIPRGPARRRQAGRAALGRPGR